MPNQSFDIKAVEEKLRWKEGLIFCGSYILGARYWCAECEEEVITDPLDNSFEQHFCNFCRNRFYDGKSGKYIIFKEIEESEHVAEGGV
jgi:hypothetical protein